MTDRYVVNRFVVVEDDPGGGFREAGPIAEAARNLLDRSGGLLLPWDVHPDGATVRLDVNKEDLLALRDALVRKEGDAE